MVCNCVKEIEEDLIENGYKDADLVDVGFFNGDKKLEWATVSNIEYVDGQTKGGKDRIKKIPIRHSHCPFCGKKADSFPDSLLNRVVSTIYHDADGIIASVLD